MDDVDDAGGRGGRALRLSALALGSPLGLACAWSLLGPPSVEAAVFALAVLGGLGGCLARGARRRRRLLVGAVAVAGAVIAARLVVAAEGTSVRDEPGRWLDRVVPERDLALSGSRLLMAVGAMPEDAPGLLDALDDGYRRMRAAEGAVPSPVVRTVLLRRAPSSGRLVVEPRPDVPATDAAVVFLHGFMGSTTLLCWQVARAPARLGMRTVCPQTDYRARWHRPEPRRVVEGTIEELRAAGVGRVYLAGLSAGAIGASRLARRADIDGLILISGCDPGAAAARVPTLVLQGRLDRMTPSGPARRCARAAPRGRLVEVGDAGHWLALSHHERVEAEIERFLAAAEGGARR